MIMRIVNVPMRNLSLGIILSISLLPIPGIIENPELLNADTVRNIDCQRDAYISDVAATSIFQNIAAAPSKYNTHKVKAIFRVKYASLVVLLDPRDLVGVAL